MSRDYDEVYDADRQLGEHKEPVVEPVEESPEMAAAADDDTILPDLGEEADEEDVPPFEPPS